MNQKSVAILLVVGLCLSGLMMISPDDTEIIASAQAIPPYSEGYGFDNDTMTMYDHNGFAYSYMPDGIIKLTLPWGYVTYFSFGMTATYSGVPAIRTALDYSWSWAVDFEESFNDTGVSEGYDYTFTAVNLDGVLDWTIQFEFSHAIGTYMKVNHILKNEYPLPLVDASFWYLFDLSNTPSPYTIETSLGTVDGPLYQAIPDSVYWARLSNEFQFNWKDALTEYENGMAYIGDGDVIGLPGLQILGISIELGDIPSNGVVTIDPYFSGVTRTWNAGSASYSGIAANWNPVGVPATGDNITFDGTSVYNCIWNSSVTLGNFSMMAGYSGVVTQATSFGSSDFKVSSGTFTPATPLYLICDGNFTISGSGTLTANLLDLRLIYDGATVTMNSENAFNVLNISNDVTLSFPGGNMRANSVIIGEYTATIAPTTTFIWKAFFGNTYSNHGTISGDGTFKVNVINTDSYFNPGNISCNSIFNLQSFASGGHKLYLTGNCHIQNSLTLISYSGPLTFSLIANGYSVIIDETLTVGSYGILDAGNSTITVGTSWTSTSGTYEHDSNKVVLYGTGTLATASTDSFYDLDISGTISTTSSVNVTHDLDVSGTLTVGAGKTTKWISNGDYDNTGTIAGTGIMEFAPTANYSMTFGDVTCPVVFSGSNTVTLDSDTEFQNDITVDSVLASVEIMTTISEDCTLDFTDESYLWNVTVLSGITVTFVLDIDAIRVVNSGTYAGGSFIEPEPEFTSVPETTLYVGSVWSYTWSQEYWDTFAVESMPGWMIYETDTHTLKAMPNATGFVEFSISLTWENMTTYQNVTLLIEPSEPYMGFGLFMYFAAMLIILATNIIGYVRIPILCLFGIFGVAILCVPTILAFGEYYWIALVLILMNIMVPIMATDRLRKE